MALIQSAVKIVLFFRQKILCPIIQKKRYTHFNDQKYLFKYGRNIPGQYFTSLTSGENNANSETRLLATIV